MLYAFISTRNAKNISWGEYEIGLGSDDNEELTCYNKLRKEMDEIKKGSVKNEYLLIGIPPKEWINEPKHCLLIDGSLMLNDSFLVRLTTKICDIKKNSRKNLYYIFLLYWRQARIDVYIC